MIPFSRYGFIILLILTTKVQMIKYILELNTSIGFLSNFSALLIQKKKYINCQQYKNTVLGLRSYKITINQCVLFSFGSYFSLLQDKR